MPASRRVGEPDRAADRDEYTDTVAAGSYFYRVTAEDAAGNVGAASNEAAATVGDTQAPSAPGTLCGGGGGRAGDALLGRRERQRRGCPLQRAPGHERRLHAQPGEPDRATDYDRLRRQHGPGQYFYRVTAEDAAGNIGPVSNEAAATVTADTTAPSAPTGLTAPVTGSTVNLSWSASTDNVGVVRYNLHRGTSSGFTPTARTGSRSRPVLSYSDTGLATGSYFYKLTAEDAAGNISPASNEAPPPSPT